MKSKKKNSLLLQRCYVSSLNLSKDFTCSHNGKVDWEEGGGLKYTTVAVVQTHLKFICSIIHLVILFFRIFKILSIPNLKSWEAEILRECSLLTMCHMSCVTCHMSHVSCQISSVKCHYFFLQSCGASRGRVCYQWGLPLSFLFF